MARTKLRILNVRGVSLRFITWLRQKVGGQALLDGGTWVLAVFLSGVLRYEFVVTSITPDAFLTLGLTLALLGFVLGKIIGLYRSRYLPATFEELLALLVSTGILTGFASVFVYLFGPAWGIPRSIVLIAGPLFLLASGGSRAWRRFTRQRSRLPLSGKRSLIYGAGQLSEVLVPQLLNDPQSPFLPVGLIDDDPSRAHRWIAGVKMKGTFADFASVVAQTGAQAVIVSIPQATSETLTRINAVAMALGVEVVILPSFSEIVSRNRDPIPLRKLGIEDLIGRRAVVIDSPEVSSLISGKTVLVTGAGGSIGSELCRQVSRYQPGRLIFLDRDETGLQHAQLLTQGNGLLDSADIVLSDIRDTDEVARIFERFRPETVFHAAALKHLPMLEKFPGEAWKTNVEGTLNLLEASRRVKVETFVNISTDKAADPSSVLGRSKRLAEELTAWAGRDGSGKYLSVRFGNVLGSRGSLVPTLSYLIDKGEVLTITDPEATRYFMTISEACQLVLQAGTEDSDSSIFVLDMGTPVRVMDIANRMIEMSGKKIDIRVTGLRPGEKLHEVLFSGHESLEPSSHSLIGRLRSAHRSPKELGKLYPLFMNGSMTF